MQQHVLRHQAGQSKRSLSLSLRRMVHDGSVWDSVGYLLVLCLAVYLLSAHLGFFSEASKPPDSPHVENQTADVSAASMGQVSGPVAGQGNSTSRDTVERGYSSANRIAPDMLLERLELLDDRPRWTLLDIDVAQMQQDLSRLIREGDTALPAIAKFLAQGGDVDFTKGGLDEAAGYPSLRLALFAVLERIGGHQVESIFYDELHRTQRPTEIEALGHYLNDTSPGLYDQDIVRAARDVFLAGNDEGAERADTGPLFKVFSRFGDASLVHDLAQVNQLNWGRYAAITLATIPEGKGVPVLSDWVYGAHQSDSGAQFAIKILAQSSEYPAAANAIINSVRANLIPDRRWAELSQLIAGTYHMQLDPPGQGGLSNYKPDIRYGALRTTQYISRTPGGGQVVYGVEFASSVLAADQILPRMELVDQLLVEVRSPVAKRELEKAYETLWLLHLQQEK
ncbi:hypothetical protein ACQUQP_13115 [Marinobacterium sp. YM272]|uniref:hypothetical protein n=1 Tax=Marinobacterium sp. YM272 TaxID=3421654 RepID=UPI003D7FFD3E